MNLIQSDGVPRWGRLSALPDQINWQDFDLRNAMGQKRAAWVRPYLLKHFDFYGAVGRGFTFGCGMVRLGVVNSTFVYLHSEKTGLVRRQFDLPLDLGLAVDYSPLGTSSWRHPLKSAHHAVSHRTLEGRTLSFQFGDDFSGLLQIACKPESVLALNTPIANTGFAYAQKTSGGAVSGTIQLAGVPYELDPERDGCYHDWTTGFLRRETFWNWACASGRVEPGKPMLSINLARGVNETSAHENVIWVDGTRHDLPLVFFEYDRDNVHRPWRVYSQCGLVDLVFNPTGSIDDHRNLGIIASRFNQCFGAFTGTVQLPGTDSIHCVDGLSGWCEDHYAKW